MWLKKLSVVLFVHKVKPEALYEIILCLLVVLLLNSGVLWVEADPTKLNGSLLGHVCILRDTAALLDYAVWWSFSSVCFWTRTKNVHTWGVLTFRLLNQASQPMLPHLFGSVLLARKQKGSWHLAINCQLSASHFVLRKRFLSDKPQKWLRLRHPRCIDYVLSLKMFIWNKYIWRKSFPFHRGKNSGPGTVVLTLAECSFCNTAITRNMVMIPTWWSSFSSLYQISKLASTWWPWSSAWP